MYLEEKMQTMKWENMKDIDKMIEAKEMIDKLANGVNPLNNERLEDDEIVNNVKLSRCFFYVSDILDTVIKNGGKPYIQKQRRSEFKISSQQLAEYKFSDYPISVTSVAYKINALLDDDRMKKLTQKKLAGWLVDMGIFKMVEKTNGKLRKYPTDYGKEEGFITEFRSSPWGAYNAVLCNKNAEEYIITHIDELICWLSQNDK